MIELSEVLHAMSVVFLFRVFHQTTIFARKVASFPLERIVYWVE
jgi:hypothetical protein